MRISHISQVPQAKESKMWSAFVQIFEKQKKKAFFQKKKKQKKHTSWHKEVLERLKCDTLRSRALRFGMKRSPPAREGDMEKDLEGEEEGDDMFLVFSKWSVKKHLLFENSKNVRKKIRIFKKKVEKTNFCMQCSGSQSLNLGSSFPRFLCTPFRPSLRASQTIITNILPNVSLFNTPTNNQTPRVDEIARRSATETGRTRVLSTIDWSQRGQNLEKQHEECENRQRKISCVSNWATDNATSLAIGERKYG